MSKTVPTTANRTLRRLPNATYRPREYLTEAEVERLIEAARKRGRNGCRDACAILLAYRHRLRAAELCQLRWSQIDFKSGRLHVNRAKPAAGARKGADALKEISSKAEGRPAGAEHEGSAA
jgi:type 1 fimbriae regulatory protein FimB/type 1 fimbriae regulatory protein FimE